MVEAALLKDIGTTFEREIPEIVRLLQPLEPSLVGEHETTAARSLDDMLGETVLHAPGFTLRGGTREILRGMIARGMGLR
jgi:hypothetical protein